VGLFDFLKKKKSHTIKTEMIGYENSKKITLNSDPHENEDELWDMSITPILNREIRPLETCMVSYAVAAENAKRVSERKIALEGVVTTFYEIKQKCNQLGAEYQKYFSCNWEHCHNLKNPDFLYVERFEKELDDLNANYNKLIAQEEIHDMESVNLEERVISCIKKSNNILQTDIYKQFHPFVKSDIQSILYELEKKGQVERKKSGRTYVVHYL
jgi:uncharacterized membrane protein